MGKSYRLRTQVGVDKEIQVNLEQDWESIEILSLKIVQSDEYLKMCSDYGVIAGRVIANGGYGVPNVRVSVFVPIDEIDIEDPIISTLYPYTSIFDVNEDGYRYNLLPYERSHGGHRPTGTFPSIDDVLKNQTVIEVFEKYYKYTVKTNDSGDYMIFGAPLGNQTVVMDMDLSDIGPFSLAPQDLIKMGKATEEQTDGPFFKTSTNLDELPQILRLTENVDVSPFWGEEDVCQIRIERVDFDLRVEGIEITPTATFIGSIVSTSDNLRLKRNCKPSLEGGNLCELVVGPGEIIAIRQTPFLDEFDRPILEEHKLENGGNVIDEDGTWLVELPMNLDYIVTNEFGEQIISDDPTVGIATSSKYRFKVKWNQPNDLTQEVRRAYFLVPNIKEYGWVSGPTSDPKNLPTTSDEYQSLQASYYFGLDWSGYTTGTSVSIDQRIEDAINCVDTFYQFTFNKVYTVSSFIDEYKNGSNRARFLGIKEITDRECETENNRFPTTDGVQNFDILFFITTLFLNILFLPLQSILIASHVLAFIWPILKYLIAFVFGILVGIVQVICEFLNLIGAGFTCPSATGAFDSVVNAPNPFTQITLPNLSYPDCQACDCESNPTNNDEGEKDAQGAYEQNSPSCNVSLFNENNYNTTDGILKKILSGYGNDNDTLRTLSRKVGSYNSNFLAGLPIWERANLFNLKSKYFDTDVTPGVNRIKTIFEPNLNDDDLNLYHEDNVVVLLVNNNCLTKLSAGQLLSFNSLSTSTDPNPTVIPTGSTLNGITGTTEFFNTLDVEWAEPTNPNATNNVTTYSFSSSDNIVRQKFPTDIEYFQVITGLTVSDFTAQTTNLLYGNFEDRVLTVSQITSPYGTPLTSKNATYSELYSGFSGLGVVVMVRGVDPNSGRHDVRYNLSRIFGYNSYIPQFDINGSYYLNIPIKNNLKLVRHDGIVRSDDVTPEGQLFYGSYGYTPGVDFQSFNTSGHTFYSSLDADRVNNYEIITSLNTSTLLFNLVTRVGGVLYSDTTTGNVFVDSGTTNGLIFYSYLGEYIEGGSYVTNESIVIRGSIPTTFKYFAPTYSALTATVVATNIVMRSDRLPTSSVLDVSGNNVFALQASSGLLVQLIGDDGESSEVVTTSYGTFDPSSADDDFPTGETYNRIIESFSCNGMVDLSCYSGSGLNFNVGLPDDPCNQNLGGKVVNQGCYSLVNKPFVTLFSDIGNLTEWVNRFRVTFAFCRGIVSHTFVNSWINGTLFAYSFQNDTIFDTRNRPVARFCTDTIFFDRLTNNFYYRSSPYNQNSDTFVGNEVPNSSPVKYIQAPTTILDMGPKYFWTKDVTLDPTHFGYYVDQLNATSYGDVSGLLQLFAIARLTNDGFLGLLAGAFSNAPIQLLFSRPGSKVDADYAQMIQINSQFGVEEFTAENYPQGAGGTSSPIYVGSYEESLVLGIDVNRSMFGVFFSADTQQRDFVSPRRIIRDQDRLLIVADNLPTLSQRVPFYKWDVVYNSGSRDVTIFGEQTNNWFKDYTGSTGFDTENYQNFKRELLPYFEGDSLIVKDNPGFIYSIQSTSSNKYQINNVSGNQNQRTMVGAPWYFYFGLKKGASAMDKFYQKYIDKP